MKGSNRDFAMVFTAYISWGLLPAFWKLLSHVPAERVMFQRTLWSAVFLALLLAGRGRLGGVLKRLRAPRRAAALTISAALLAVNWFVYIWAIANNLILSTSMGYFICPILSIVLGTVLLREPLTRAQCWGTGLMVAGVLLRGVLLGAAPWIALTIAGSFSFYTLVRKIERIDVVEGLFLENVLMLIPARLLLSATAAPELFSASIADNALFVISGLATALPMLCLVAGAQTVPLKYVGVIQYLNPTLLFILAIFVYGEPLTSADLLSLPLIWLGVAIFISGAWFLKNARHLVLLPLFEGNR